MTTHPDAPSTNDETRRAFFARHPDRAPLPVVEPADLRGAVLYKVSDGNVQAVVRTMPRLGGFRVALYDMPTGEYVGARTFDAMRAAIDYANSCMD